MTVEVSVLKNADKIAEAIDDLTEKIGGGDLQPATADTLGGVKIGEGISVTSDGTISAGGASLLIVNDVEGTLDKKWQEIYDAMNGGSIVLIKSDFGDNGYTTALATASQLSGGSYLVVTEFDGYATDSANGYPAVS